MPKHQKAVLESYLADLYSIFVKGTTILLLSEKVPTIKEEARLHAMLTEIINTKKLLNGAK